MYVHQTAIFVDKTTRWGLERNVKTHLNGLSLVDALPASWRLDHGYVNKREAWKYRFIGKLVPVQGETVLVLLDAFLRGDHGYHSYLRDPARYGGKHLDPLIDLSQLTTRRRSADLIHSAQLS